MSPNESLLHRSHRRLQSLVERIIAKSVHQCCLSVPPLHTPARATLLDGTSCASGSSTTASAAGKAGDDNAEEGDDTVNDGSEDGSDSADNGHDD